MTTDSRNYRKCRSCTSWGEALTCFQPSTAKLAIISRLWAWSLSPRQGNWSYATTLNLTSDIASAASKLFIENYKIPSYFHPISNIIHLLLLQLSIRSISIRAYDLPPWEMGFRVLVCLDSETMPWLQQQFLFWLQLFIFSQPIRSPFSLRFLEGVEVCLVQFAFHTSLSRSPF